MAVLIRDEGVEARIRAERQSSDAARWDEVWSGVLVMPPMPNNDHQRLVIKLCSIFSTMIDWDAGDSCLPGANVSDREIDWQFDYRVPDVLVAKADGKALDRGTHWVGGPDLVVEIISAGEEPYAKLDFYSSIGVREMLIVQRDPWIVEQFTMQNGKLIRKGRCTDAGGEIVSDVLDFHLRIQSGSRLILDSAGVKQKWVV